jgi:Cell division protein ZapA
MLSLYDTFQGSRIGVSSGKGVILKGVRSEKNVYKYILHLSYMQELIPLNILVGDRNYRIRIQAGDEESVRKISKLINEKILEFKTIYAGKDMQDYISMVLLWFVTEQQSGQLDDGGVGEALAGLENLLNKEI